MENTRRWTTNPDFYLKTFNPRTGHDILQRQIDLIVDSDSAAPTPGARAAASRPERLRSDRANRPPQPGFITVEITYEPNESYCGRAQVGANPGRIWFKAVERCADTRWRRGKQPGHGLIAHRGQATPWQSTWLPWSSSKRQGSGQLKFDGAGRPDRHGARAAREHPVLASGRQRRERWASTHDGHREVPDSPRTVTGSCWRRLPRGNTAQIAFTRAHDSRTSWGTTQIAVIATSRRHLSPDACSASPLQAAADQQPAWHALRDSSIEVWIVQRTQERDEILLTPPAHVQLAR